MASFREPPPVYATSTAESPRSITASPDQRYKSIQHGDKAKNTVLTEQQNKIRPAEAL